MSFQDIVDLFGPWPLAAISFVIIGLLGIVYFCLCSRGRRAHRLFKLGKRYMADGDYHAAGLTLKKSIAASHSDKCTIHFAVYGLLGISQFKCGQYEEALVATNQALTAIDLSIEPTLAVARLYYQRSMIHSALGNEHEAIQDYDQATHLDPKGDVRPRHT